MPVDTLREVAAYKLLVKHGVYFKFTVSLRHQLQHNSITMNMHNKLAVAAVVLVASAAVATDVHAQTAIAATGGARVDTEINLDGEAKLDRDTEESTSASVSVETHVQSTTTVRNGERDDRDEDRETTEKSRDERATSTEQDHGTSMSEEHRSVVATFVKSLLSVADREEGIGSEVRTVAHTQNDAASTTATAIVKVEERGSIRTFLFGSDYKNLGVIRSALATTSANIAHLKALLGRAESPADTAELTLQIKALESEQGKVSAYVTAHEDTFSLFGWFTKLVVK